MLYDLLLARGDDPVVRMNRAIAVSRLRTPADGLALLDALSGDPSVERHHPFHVARALLLQETGCAVDAAAAWRQALQFVDHAGERRFVEERLRRLDVHGE